MLTKGRLKRKTRIRKKVFGSEARPRLSVYRSNMHIYAQIVDDSKGVTLVSASDLDFKDKKATRTEISMLIGERLAELCKKKKIEKIVFDRGGYRYHGRVKAIAEGARKGGLVL